LEHDFRSRSRLRDVAGGLIFFPLSPVPSWPRFHQTRGIVNPYLFAARAVVGLRWHSSLL